MAKKRQQKDLFDTNKQQETPKKKKKEKEDNVSSGSIAYQMAAKQKEISISEFFAKNRHLLGFDNPRKSLLTTIKEAVDNSLDACEEASILPDIEVQIIHIIEDKYRVIIEDNGPGILGKQIPKIFGKLLYGSKFHRLKMSRGQQGIGISAAGMYGQLTTGKPMKITSRINKSRQAHYYVIKIDTMKNQPEIVEDVQINWDREHGTRVEIELVAKYIKGQRSVDEYLFQTSLANPHVKLTYISPEGEKIEYSRVSDIVPVLPSEIQPHPYGVELGVFQRMIKSSQNRQLKKFLTKEFCRVSSKVADEIITNVGMVTNTPLGGLTTEQIEKLHKSMATVKIMAPPTNCIAPIGADLICEALKKRFNPSFFTASTRTPSVYRGNPFLVEVGLAYSEELPADSSIQLYRYANRVPLLYQQSACAINKSVIATAWKNYKLNQSHGALPIGPVALMVHVASVWVPFTSESKEAIAHYPEIIKEIKLAIQECGRRLSIFLNKKRKAEDAAMKKSYIASYIPHIAESIKEILKLSQKQEKKMECDLREILEKSRT